jgi:mevalonate kinase
MDFPAKILLLGEYGILLNSVALSIPYPFYSGRLRFPEGAGGMEAEKETASHKELSGMFAYLAGRRERFGFLELERFALDLEHGLYFDSTVPQGSGLGSSGALTAAIYARYAKEGISPGLPETRERLGAIESCFHGQSSGIDPLTSFLGQPVLATPQAPYLQTVDLSRFLETYTLFLVNSHREGATGELVAHFMDRCKDPGYREKMEHIYLPLLEESVNAIVTGDFDTLDTALQKLELFQLTWFEKMIPPVMRPFFEEGAGRADGHFKLCGSGGGGYLLTISRNRTQAENYLTSRHLSYSVVQPSGILTNQLFT